MSNHKRRSPCCQDEAVRYLVSRTFDPTNDDGYCLWCRRATLQWREEADQMERLVDVRSAHADDCPGARLMDALDGLR